MPNPWFRFYSESLRDRKLERVARVTGQPKALLIGVWVTLLSLANDSPIPGALLLTEDIALGLEDFALETGIEPDLLILIIDRFLVLQMLTLESGVYLVTNWDKRQFKSDSSVERVRRYRERKAATQDGDAHDDVTLPDRYSNAPETEQNRTDTEAEQKEIPSTSADYQAVRLLWSELFPDKPQPRDNNKTLQGKVKTRMASAHFQENWEPALRRAARSTFCRTEGWFDLGWFLKNDDNYEKCLNGNYDQTARASPRGSPSAMEDYEAVVRERGLTLPGDNDG